MELLNKHASLHVDIVEQFFGMNKCADCDLSTVWFNKRCKMYHIDTLSLLTETESVHLFW